MSCISFAKSGMKGGETSTVINRWLVVEFEFLSEFEESVDTLLLREDAVRLVRDTFFVPPSSFFWPTVFLADVVELDCFWGTTIKGFDPVVLINPISCCACTGVMFDAFLEE